MNWQYILKANWTFISNPNSSSMGSYNRNTKTININLVAYKELLEMLFEHLKESGAPQIVSLLGNMTLNQALDAPVGEIFEKFLMDRIIHTMEHESIHEAHHLTGLREEVINIFSNSEYSDINDALFIGLSTENRRIATGADIWELFISKYYDELFVRVQQGDTYETALKDTVDYIKDWMEDWKETAIMAASNNPLLGIQMLPIFTLQINRIWKQFESVYTALTDWLAERAKTLMENMENMISELGDSIVESINNMSEEDLEELKIKWKSNLRAQSQLSESGREGYKEHKNILDRYG